MKRTLTLTSLALLISAVAGAQTRPQARRLITERIDETRLHTFAGNTRPEATAANDLGRVPDTLAMQSMMLQLQRTPEREQALQAYIESLHDPKSPNYHQWLSAQDFGNRYGAAPEDIATIRGWLESHGFHVNAVYPSGMLIDFSGTAGQVRDAFRTEIHYVNARGQRHIANVSDPAIPAALAAAVAGVVSMHDFAPHTMARHRGKYTYASSGSGTYLALTPEDLATIYSLTPLFAAGITGKGQTIAVVEDSNLYRTSDFDTFRSTFGLSQYSSGSLVTVHPGSNCIDPGVVAGDDGEATLDAEWASAAAPDATIQVASCANTRTTFGGLIAIQNLVNSSTPPSVISLSYGECEALNGATVNAAYNTAFQQAVAEGISVFVAAGDEGAASCDAGSTGASHGIGVSGFASTPYNVAVGGTDFADSYSKSNSSYWSTTNSANYGSATAYIPEIPWNDSCAGTLLAGYLGFSAGFGTSGLCSSTTARQDGLLQVAAGSGGPSGCATGRASTSGVVSGTCQGYAKPAWQAGLSGNPNDGVRDIPDVSLFAGTGVWGHYFVVCWTNSRAGGAPCTGEPSAWAGAGGTSFSAPIMAGIQALVNQNEGVPQGNPNYTYYKLAARADVNCDSAAGDAGSACVFHNVRQGDIAVNCGGSQDCFGAVSSAGTGRRGSSSANGALSTSTQSFTPAFGAAAGWNFATGIGSVNAYNLVMQWGSVQ